MIAANLPVIVYIAPGGSRAGSAGVFITYASHVAAMAPSTNIGAAHPVQLGGEQKKDSNIWEELREAIRDQRDKQEDQKKNESVSGEDAKDKESQEESVTSDDADPMSSKILNDTVAFIRSIAEREEETPIGRLKVSRKARRSQRFRPLIRMSLTSLLPVTEIC
jgi:membrane-bound serine protease (ClpP class)